ncbi:iron complex transport system substrate-binding protein [Actinacidiphila alni]|uniref:Iron complex transport system substrate-binding protein n=1 Tax=Actinacidiphila alni TaxID=380248 RepID=A0A1I2JY60_9ACTN|nr:ABC transporter substrate-binding protein [Actinacidiphila alni]SFF59775.1 iron complex transport system substrate-binding protein [Actinacidiphila alni]
MRARGGYGVAVALIGLLAAGCSDGGDSGGKDGSDSGDRTAAAATNASAPGFPVTVSDCAGKRTTFTSPPKAIVTSNASGLELLLRLGAGDKVIGTGFPPGRGAMPAPYDARARRVPVLGKAVVPKEKLLGSGADVYIDTFASMGGMGDAPTEAEYRAAGIKHLYLKSTACAAMSKAPLTDLTAVEADVTTFGAVTGTSARAAELVDGMRRTVGAVTRAIADVPESERPTYFFFDYDAGTEQPTAVCDRQVANAVITLAGARNVFSDCHGGFQQVGWEDVIARDPDWIQLGVRNHGSPAADAKAFDAAETWLTSNPATKGLKAVREKHFLRIGSERTTIAGVGDADTVREIARTLYPGKVS